MIASVSPQNVDGAEQRRLDELQVALVADGSLAVMPSTSTRQACAVAVRPRTSSKTSGLRFCGMIDEPVVNVSGSSTKPNSRVVEEQQVGGEAPRSCHQDRHLEHDLGLALPRDSCTAVTRSWFTGNPRRVRVPSRLTGRLGVAVARGRPERVLEDAAGARERSACRVVRDLGAKPRAQRATELGMACCMCV